MLSHNLGILMITPDLITIRKHKNNIYKTFKGYKALVFIL